MSVQPLERQARDAIGVAVETLIALLDNLDGDADCEPDDEPEDDDPGGGNADDEGEPEDSI